MWTRQLAGLVGSGLPVERALTALADESESERQRELVAHLKSEVNAGSPFARALATAPREFDEIYRAVVAAGEQSGALGAVLDRLADDLEAQHALRARLMGAMLYPAIVSTVALVIVIVLMTYVVPQIAGVFTSSKRALPVLTVAMLAHQRLRAPVGLGGGAAGRRRRHGLRAGAARARPFASAATPRCCGCRWSGGWRAATTRRVSAARWRCWPVPACRS